jgi:hypothetical protein
VTNIRMIHDLKDPDDPQGRSYKEVNAATAHAIPIGTLIEIDVPDFKTHGVRLFVVHHTRDCDMTPLYNLCHDPNDTEVERPGFRNPAWTGGYSEDSLKVIREPKEEGSQR